MRERRVGSLVVRAEASDEALDWLSARLPAEPVNDAFVLGGLLVRVELEGEDRVLSEPDLGRAAPVDEPSPYVAGVTRALTLGHEEWRVHQSYRDVPGLEGGLFHGSRVAVGPAWDRPGGFFAMRRRPLGGDSGWSIHPDMEHLEITGYADVRDLITRRPMLARFLMWPAGTTVDWQFGCLSVHVEEQRIAPAGDGWLGKRFADPTPIALDPIGHRDLIERFRKREWGSAIGYADWVAEVLLVSRDQAVGLSRAIERHVAADALFEVRFVRLLRQLLRQGRAQLAIEQLMQTGRLETAEAEGFLERHRVDIEAGRVPPRI